MMSQLMLKLIMSVLFAVLGCFLVGYATSWHIGLGIFFIMWASAGLIEIVQFRIAIMDRY
jgi:hypothetical protein